MRIESQVILVGPKSSNKHPYQRYTQRRSNEAIEAETEVMKPQAKECQEPPKTGGGKGWIVPKALKEDTANTLISRLRVSRTPRE